MNASNFATIRPEPSDTLRRLRMTAPESYDYRMREFHVWDADGDLLRFGEPMPRSQSK